jgi:hypothetical protein
MTTQTPTRPKAPASAANRVRARVERGGERFWTLADFADLPAGAVATALSRLAADGTLQRERKGVYYRARPTPFGMSVPSASGSVAVGLGDRPLHPAGLTAANVLGFTTQNPGRQEFTTPAAAAPTALRNARVRARRRPGSRSNLSAEDGALLEFLRERAQTSDLSPDRTYARLYELLDDPARFRRLSKAALDEPPRVRAMLGALGQKIGVDDRLLRQLRKSLNPLSRFDFGLLRGLPHADEWQAK